MKFSVNRVDFLRDLQRASKFIATRVVIPALECLFISADDTGVIEISSNNLEAAVMIKSMAEVDESGCVLVPAKLLLGVVSAYKTERVEVGVSGSKLVVASGESESKISTLLPDEFTPLVMPTCDVSFTIDADDLVQITRIAATSVVQNPIHPMLSGVNYTIDGGRVTAQGTDSYSLSESSCGADVHCGKETFTIPVDVLVSTVSVLDGNVDVYVGDNNVAFMSSTATAVLQPLYGDYPNLSAIKPKTSLYRFSIDKNKLKNALDAVGVFDGNGGTNAVTLYVSDERLTVSNVTERGSGRIVIDIDPAERGYDVGLALNRIFLTNILNSSPDNEIVIEMNGEKKPVVVRCNDARKQYAIILPMHIKQNSSSHVGE